jgi:hypothetical protein
MHINGPIGAVRREPIPKSTSGRREEVLDHDPFATGSTFIKGFLLFDLIIINFASILLLLIASARILFASIFKALILPDLISFAFKSPASELSEDDFDGSIFSFVIPFS